MKRIPWKVLTLCVVVGCGAPEVSEDNSTLGAVSDLATEAEAVDLFISEDHWKDPNVWLVLAEDTSTVVTDETYLPDAVAEMAGASQTEWGLDLSTLDVGPLPGDFFDSLVVATRGASPDDWFPGPIFPLGSGTIQQHADTLVGWFVLVLRDHEGSPYKWPMFRPYIQLVASSEDGSSLFAVQREDQGLRVSRLRTGWERR